MTVIPIPITIRRFGPRGEIAQDECEAFCFGVPRSACAMPASVAAGASFETPKKKAAAAARQSASLVKQLSSALSSNQDVAKNHDLVFIIERLEGPDSDLVKHIATLLREGSLRKAASRIEASDTSGLGKELAPSMTTYRSLREPQMWAMLSMFEPEIFTAAVLEGMAKEVLLERLCFGLGVKKAMKLPAAHPLLRRANVLGAFSAIRYQKLGRRLRATNADDPGAIGYFKREGTEVKTAVRIEEASEEVSVLTIDSLAKGDWELMENYSSGAYLFNEELDEKIGLRNRFKKAGKAVPPEETMEWHIPISEWPDAMKPASAGSSVPTVAVPNRKRPRGSGCAVIEKSG